MKIRLFTAVFGLAILFIGCDNRSNAEDAGMSDSAAVSLPPKRPVAPAFKIITEYKISAKDTTGFILNVSHFDEQGRDLMTKNFNAQGTGEEAGSMTFQRNEKGQHVSTTIFDEKGNKREDSITSDDKGRTIKVVSKRSDGNKVIEEYSYDDHGGLTKSAKYRNGKHVETQKYYRTHDAKGRKVHERSVFADPDGKKADIIRSIDHYEYVGEDTIPSVVYNYDEDSVLTSKVVAEIKGLTVLYKTFVNDTLESQLEVTYNEYGEIEYSKTMSPKGDVKSTFTYRYDKYGKKVFLLYEEPEGDSWGARFVIEYQ